MKNIRKSSFNDAEYPKGKSDGILEPTLLTKAPRKGTTNINPNSITED
jgi:hypothetical protein